MRPLWDGVLEGTDLKKQRKGCGEAERNLGDSSRNKRVSQQVSERAAWSLQLGRPQGTLGLLGRGHGMGYR